MSEKDQKLPVEVIKVEPVAPPASAPVTEVFLDRLDYEHWLVGGKPKGTGKTSLAIYLILWLKKHVKSFQNFKIVSAIPVYAEGEDGYAEGYDSKKPNGYPHTNYCGTKLHPDYIPLNDYREALDAHDCFLLLDDVGLLARARDWASDTNKFFTKIAKNSRHQRLFVIYTSQRANELDIDLRYNVNRVFVPKFREDKNTLDPNHGARMEEARSQPVEWDEFIPRSAQERFCFPAEADKNRQANLIPNIDNPIDVVMPMSLRPTWGKVQTYFDTNKEPTYSKDRSITKPFRERWGKALREFLLESPESYVRRKFLLRKEYDVPRPVLEEDVNFWSKTSDTPLTDDDKSVLIHDVMIFLDEYQHDFKKIPCPKCGHLITIRNEDATRRFCKKCGTIWTPNNQTKRLFPQSAADIAKYQLEVIDKIATANKDDEDATQ